MNKKILKLLENNARMTNEDIAAVTGLDEKEVAQRIAEMEMRGVIRGYKGILDPEKTEDSSVSAINSVFCVFVFRIIWMQLFYPSCADLPTYQRFFMVTFCFLVSWTLRLLVNFVAFGIVRSKYNRGIRKVL